MHTLQEITDAWGAWSSKQNGTTCSFTASTNYGSQKYLDQYHQYQATATGQNIVYEGNNPPVSGSSIAYELWYDNGTSVQQSSIFQETSSTTQSFTWSITESVSVGVEVSMTEGVPAVMSSTQKITVTVGLSSTQGGTYSGTQTWQVNTPINVPAMSSVKADMIISTQTYSVNWTEAVLLQGYVAIWNNDQVNGHWLWFHPVEEVFQDCISNNIIDTTGYTVVNGGVQTQATGVFTGSQGINVGVSATQYPLRSSGQQAEENSGGDSLTPVTPTISLLAFPADD